MNQAARPKYVIVNDSDAARPEMVCQWVEGVGYCYMDRTGTKAAYDGMRGPEATSVETFGFIVAEDTDGITRFYRTAQPSYATYSDGEQRRWQAPGDEFEFPRLAIKVSSAP